MPSDAPGRLIPVHDTELRVYESGRADGLLVLVLDPDGTGTFAPLESTYRLVVVETRDHGSSDAASWTPQQHASDVSAVAATLGEERYVVLGHGSGTAIARQHAIDAPGAAVATVLSGGDAATLDAPQPVLVCTGSAAEIAAFLSTLTT